MKAQNKVSLAVAFLFLIAFTRADAQLTYHVIDLGTLGGAFSTANAINPSARSWASPKPPTVRLMRFFTRMPQCTTSERSRCWQRGQRQYPGERRRNRES